MEFDLSVCKVTIFFNINKKELLMKRFQERCRHAKDQHYTTHINTVVLPLHPFLLPSLFFLFSLPSRVRSDMRTALDNY